MSSGAVSPCDRELASGKESLADVVTVRDLVPEANVLMSLVRRG